MNAPLKYVWTGEGWEPTRHFRTMANKLFVVGEERLLEDYLERSKSSHDHEFAWLAEAWKNLPETLADQFPTPDHLRKRALIDAGFYVETIIDAGTNAAALRVAVFARGEDQFAAVVVRGPIVVVRKAKSQSRRAMDRVEFQKSKQGVLDVVSAMIGVTPDELQQNTGRAA